MSRIRDAFARAASDHRAAIVAYVMAADPDNARGLAYARAILAQADIIEIGIPFSDPVADGPTIERAANRALAAGARLDDALQLASALRETEPAKPIVLMTYYNPVYRRGLDKFARDAEDAGVDGVIIPDVPLEESNEPAAVLASHGLDLVLLASPATPTERLAAIASATRGFLYVVSSYGVTGARQGVAPETADLVARAKKASEGAGVPFAVGFGVSTSEQVRALHEAGAHGVIVGSAIVARIEQGETPDSVAAFVRGLRG